MPDFSIENKFKGIISGVDEAGRGPLAGPVVASAVILNQDNFSDAIDDSKKLSSTKRNIIYQEIRKSSYIGLGMCSVEEIDDLNILNATMLAMKRAVDNLPKKPSLCLIDGNVIPKNLNCDAQCIVKGDSKSLSVAAASIVAKVTRDEIMYKLAQEYPNYFWEKNSGYGTQQHIEAISNFGITKHHRRSFKPIKNLGNYILN